MDAPKLPIEPDHKERGHWIADVPSRAGVMVYGQTREAALARVEAHALRVLADRPHA